MSDRIKLIGAFSILITVFMAGFAISAGFWSSSNSALQNDLRRSRDETSQVRSELEQTKLEYSRYRDSHPDESKTALQPTPPPRQENPPRGAATSVSSPASERDAGRSLPATPVPASEKLAISEGNSATSHGGELIVSVVGIAFEGNPLRHRVTFAVGGPGSQTVTYPKQDIGAVVKWKKLEVRLLSATTFDATFMITHVGAP